jgi:hypothetical protein
MDANKKVLESAEAELIKARTEGNELAEKQWKETVKIATD